MPLSNFNTAATNNAIIAGSGDAAVPTLNSLMMSAGVGGGDDSGSGPAPLAARNLIVPELVEEPSVVAARGGHGKSSPMLQPSDDHTML